MGLDLSGCLNRYDSHGVRFDYPDIWELSEEETDGDTTITVLTDGTCFWTLRILRGRQSPPEVVNSCVAAFREEYEDVEETSSEVRLADMPAYSRELEFSCLELLNTVSLASVRTMELTLLIWWQGTDHELRDLRPVLETITDSVRVSATSHRPA
jgi:hypothetical protein